MTFEQMKSLWQRFPSEPKVVIALVLFVVVLFIARHYLSAYLAEKGRSLATRKKSSKARPYLDLEADKIEFQEWNEEEKKINPTWPDRYDKIVLWFYIHNAAEMPASNVSVTAASELLVHKEIGRFTPGPQGGTFSNRHVITRATPGRQPFTVALDKKALSYFKQGIIEIKLDVRVQYSGLDGEGEYWTRRVYVYSPTLPNEARETFSEGK
jgi:hypothetical protein